MSLFFFMNQTHQSHYNRISGAFHHINKSDLLCMKKLTTVLNLLWVYFFPFLGLQLPIPIKILRTSLMYIDKSYVNTHKFL